MWRYGEKEMGERGGLLLPYYRLATMGDEVFVGLAEMMVAKEAVVGREGRGVGRLEYEMAVGVDEVGFLLGVAAPKEEDDVGAVLADETYDGIGELLPAVTSMGVGLALTYGECGVEQEHALVSPAQ